MYCRGPKTEKCTQVSHLSVSSPSTASIFMGHLTASGKLFALSPSYNLIPICCKATFLASSHSASSLDDDECSFLSFSKREYLLAQLRQKDELIDSLLKQVCLEYSLGQCERSQSVSHFLATQSISSQSPFNRTIPQCNVFE